MTESEVVEEIGRRLAEATPTGSRVLLFGSRARGEAEEGSDYEVLVIESGVGNTAEESVRLRRTLNEMRVPIDVVVVGDEVAKRRSRVRGTMVERALREGRILARP